MSSRKDARAASRWVFLCFLCLVAALPSFAAETGACCAATLAGGDHSDESIYQLGDRWTDQDGEGSVLDTFKGEVVVFSMFFSHCQYVCPRIVADMKRIEELLVAAGDPEVRFILASMDSARDVPPVLKAYRETMRLSPERWTLLHGDERAVQNLAAVLGVKYKREANGDFGHSVVITVLNRDGEIVHQQEGLGADPSETVAKIRELIQ